MAVHWMVLEHQPWLAPSQLGLVGAYRTSSSADAATGPCSGHPCECDEAIPAAALASFSRCDSATATSVTTAALYHYDDDYYDDCYDNNDGDDDDNDDYYVDYKWDDYDYATSSIG